MVILIGPHTGLIPIISRPIFSTILANPKLLIYYLPYFFIHCLTGPYTTFVGFNPMAVTPSDPGPLKSHTYYGVICLGNVIKPVYYISGILSFLPNRFRRLNLIY